jgi:uncharacterized protein (DUF1800 family)
MLSATMMLAACGGGGSSPTVTPTGPVPTPVPVVVVTTGDAVRLAKQASFGPTQALADHIAALGTSAWLDEQFAASGSTYSDLVSRAVANNYCNLVAKDQQTVCNRDNLSSFPVATEFYTHAVQNNDQLRQRVAFALSQIIVASDFEVHTTAGLAVFNQIFLDNAFGNYRTILRAVTLNPYMGAYLNMVDSQKAAPNENYARELMQLFSMGINQLNADGVEKKDGSGAPIATFTSADVSDIARALTGWTYTRFAGAAANDGNQLDFTKPMTTNAAQFDTTAKTFLGTTVAAGATQDANIDAVVDAVFNNASTAPFVSKFLIEQLVMSNPSAAYVGRVSAIFANNGAGVRGDLKAVIRAILTDADARGNAKTGANDGKLKEPVLFSLSIARLLAFKTDGYAFTTRDAGMGQQPFRAPSVFNFYPPDYPLPLGGGLLSPPTKLITASTILARHNLAYDWTVSGDSRSEYAVQATITGSTGTQPDFSAWDALTDPAKLVDAIDLIMLNQTMTSQQRTALLAAINAVTDPVATTQAHKRAQLALYIVAASPQFQVDR